MFPPIKRLMAAVEVLTSFIWRHASFIRHQWRRLEFYNLAEQRLNPPESSWGNLGFWRQQQALQGSPHEYAAACQQLAERLAEAAQLNSASVVLDAGFGCGDQLLLWHQQFQIRNLYGINRSYSQTWLAQQRLQQQGRPTSASQCVAGDVHDLAHWRGLRGLGINRVLALDCIYHFPDKAGFLQQAVTLLRQPGTDVDAQLAYTDLVLTQPWRQIPLSQRCLLRLMLRLSRVPRGNMMTLSDNLQQLQRCSGVDARCQDLSQAVMLGFARWWQSSQVRAQYPSAGRWLRPSWLKYEITARFLRWALRQRLLGYYLIHSGIRVDHNPLASGDVAADSHD